MPPDAHKSRADVDGTSTFGALADSRRRTILAILSEREDVLPVDDLARALAARESDQEPQAIDDETTRRTARSLRHAHLPKLANAGLIRRTDGVVSLAYTEPAIRAAELLARTDASEAASLDDGFEALADRRRRVVLAVLQESDAEIPVSILAEQIATRSESTRSAARIAISLDHVHLPKLDALGIVTYDRDAGTVTLLGLPRACQRLLSELGPDLEESSRMAVPGA